MKSSIPTTKGRCEVIESPFMTVSELKGKLDARIAELEKERDEWKDKYAIAVKSASGLLNEIEKLGRKLKQGKRQVMTCKVCGETPEPPNLCKCCRIAARRKSEIMDLARRLIDIRTGVYYASVKSSVYERREFFAKAITKAFRINPKKLCMYVEIEAIAERLYDQGVRAHVYRDR